MGAALPRLRAPPRSAARRLRRARRRGVPPLSVTALGLILAVASSVAINGGYALQHASASALPPLTLRRPFHSLALLFRSGRWTIGFFAGIGGWVLYVVALALAPLSLVQAASAGGIVVLADRRAAADAAPSASASRHRSPACSCSRSRSVPTLAPRDGNAAAVIVWMLASAGVAGAAARAAAARARGSARPPASSTPRATSARRPRSRAARGCSSSRPCSPATGWRSRACSSPSSAAAASRRPALRCSGRTRCRSSRARCSSARACPAAGTAPPASRRFALVLVGAVALSRARAAPTRVASGRPRFDGFKGSLDFD